MQTNRPIWRRILPPKRHRTAWLFAWTASVVAVVLAIGPNLHGSYDSSLAILTLTVVAIIWYTYFTYRSVNAYVPTLVRARVDGHCYSNAVTLAPEVTNDSPNHIRLRLALEVWVDNIRMEQDPFWSAIVSIMLEPRAGFTESVRFSEPPFPQPTQDSVGELLRGYSECRVRYTVFWRDQFGELGVCGPKHYCGSGIGTGDLKGVIAQPEIERLFGTLPPPPRDVPVVWDSD